MSTPAAALARKIGNIDIQFGPAFDQQKANLLVQTLQQVVAAVNANAQAVQAAANAPPATPIDYLLGSPEGLGPYITVEGLTAGQTLVATSAETAQFEFLGFGQLKQSDALTFAEPANGDVISYVNGYWSAIPSVGILGLEDPGVDAVVMWDTQANAGEGGFNWATAGAGISLESGTISALTYVPPAGDTALTWLDM